VPDTQPFFFDSLSLSLSRPLSHRAAVDKYELQQEGHEEDVHAILSTLAIKRFRPEARIVVEVFTVESQKHLEMYNLSNLDVICIEELRNGILAHSCIHPGLSTMMINMVRTVDHQEHRAAMQGAREPLSIEQRESGGEQGAGGDNTNSWLAEYEWGASHQLYALNLKMYRGIAFGVLTEHLCKTYGFVLIGVEEHSTGMVLRNPGNLYLICAEDKGYVLSRMRLSADHISEVEHMTSPSFVSHVADMRSQSTVKRKQSVATVQRQIDLGKVKPELERVARTRGGSVKSRAIRKHGSSGGSSAAASLKSSPAGTPALSGQKKPLSSSPKPSPKQAPNYAISTLF